MSIQLTITAAQAIQANQNMSLTLNETTGCWSLGDSSAGVSVQSVTGNLDIASFRVSHETIHMTTSTSTAQPMIVVNAKPTEDATALSGMCNIPPGVTVTVSGQYGQVSLSSASTTWSYPLSVAE